MVWLKNISIYGKIAMCGQTLGAIITFGGRENVLNFCKNISSFATQPPGSALILRPNRMTYTKLSDSGPVIFKEEIK